MEDRRLGAVDDLILTAPEQQLAEDLGEHPGRADHEVDGGGQRGVQVRISDQLPARLVQERQPDVEDDEVEIREVGRGAVHVPGLGVFDGLRAQWHSLVDADEVDTELARLLEDRKRHPRVVHPPRVRRTVVVPDIVELERSRAELAHLAFHEVQRLAAFERVDRAPEDRAIGVTAGELCAALPR
jgi:hypothetical protein